jgi:hypothetical protein
MRSAAALLLCLLALTGCGSSGDGGDDGGDTGSDAAPESCGLLSDAHVAELAAQPVTQSRADEVGALPACLYMVENGDKVQVIDVPASQWSRELPALLDQVERSGVVNDPATRDKLAAARKKLGAAGALDDDAACALFSDLLEIQGLPAGEERIVNFVPTREDPQGINGQTCTDGVYTSVQLQSAELGDAQAAAARVETALEAAHRASVE